MSKFFFLILVFFLFFIPTIIFAQEENEDNRIKEMFNVSLTSLDHSPYTMDFVSITKNTTGELVSVISGHVYAYLPHPILDDYLNKFPSDYVTKNGVNYKKWVVWILKNQDGEKAIHGSELKADWCTWLMNNPEKNLQYLHHVGDIRCTPTIDNIVIIRADHASIVVEKGDTTDYFITVLKRLN
jgi:hypothetical protein